MHARDRTNEEIRREYVVVVHHLDTRAPTVSVVRARSLHTFAFARHLGLRLVVLFSRHVHCTLVSKEILLVYFNNNKLSLWSGCASNRVLLPRDPALRDAETRESFGDPPANQRRDAASSADDTALV